MVGWTVRWIPYHESYRYCVEKSKVIDRVLGVPVVTMDSGTHTLKEILTTGVSGDLGISSGPVLRTLIVVNIFIRVMG